MIRFIIATFFVMSYGLVIAQNQFTIIPEPVKIEKKKGDFILPRNIFVEASSNASIKKTVDFLKEKLSIATGYTVKLASKKSENPTINLQLNMTPDAEIGDEGYKLSVTSKNVAISANKPAGIYYGVQSFLQLLPAEIESNTLKKNVRWVVPMVEITDYPRMGWRGLMLDVARHFFTVKEVKQYIDAMARYKYNLLHLHLTDDEGWRIEIKSLPNLTKIGAWNVKKEGNFGTFSKPEPNEPRNYGGFYTQEQIKEIIAYAKDRFINILPEIDVPGHSLAVIASYPELSCTEGADKYQVRSGEEIMDWSHGAPPIALVDNTLCPANEKVYDFMDKVMTEVAQLFPFEYVHVGGDEAPHNFWEKSPQIKALMEREGLKTMPQVQAYFENRLEKIVNAKGKKMMGWDEVLEGGVSKTTAIMSWRGEAGGVTASKEKHFVVMSPTTYAYIDYMQGDVSTEPRVYASLRLNKTYEFDPVPQGADANYILGGQANLWTEQVYNIRQAEYMTWPRGFAIAEALWTPTKNKDWEKFVIKTEQHFKRLDYAEIKYSPAMYDPIVTVAKKENKYYVELATEIEGLDIYYSFDNSTPDRFYPKYKGELEVPKDAYQMRLITFKNKNPIGRLMSIKVEDLKKRVK